MLAAVRSPHFRSVKAPRDRSGSPCWRCTLIGHCGSQSRTHPIRKQCCTHRPRCGHRYDAHCHSRNGEADAVCHPEGVLHPRHEACSPPKPDSVTAARRNQRPSSAAGAREVHHAPCGGRPAARECRAPSRAASGRAGRWPQAADATRTLGSTGLRSADAAL